MLKSKKERPCPCGSGRKLKKCCQTIERASEVIARLELAAKRPCGDCQACCELVGVKELGKPYGTKCQHQCATGCAIYAARPTTCRQYNCFWKFTPQMDDDLRPDKCGILLDADRMVGGKDTLLVYETRPNAIKLMPQKLADIIDAIGENTKVLLIHYGQTLATAYPIQPPYEKVVRPLPRARQLEGDPNFYVLVQPNEVVTAV